jgi:EAL domain-containing protein (putative c-di-GMP-specific phosphodiesterase class I)
MHAETLDWMTRIKQTIRDDAFRLAFQPIVTLEDTSVHHYEALSRLPTSVKSSPFRFITMAEQLGHIAEFDLAVLRRVTSLVHDGHAGSAPVAVNVSGRSLTTPDFADRFLDCLDSYQDPGASLLVEVTESCKITDLAVASRALAAIRALGVKVCLDDFGVGAAAFEYLRAIAVDFVKIDGSFVREIGNPGFDRAFVQSIATLCDTLGIKTIGEQIEDEPIAEGLKSLGITHGQGFLFGAPGAEVGWAGARGEPVARQEAELPPRQTRALIERAFSPSKNPKAKAAAPSERGVAS